MSESKKRKPKRTTPAAAGPLASKSEWQIIMEAIRAVPAVKYSLGGTGIAILVAVAARAFAGDFRTLILAATSWLLFSILVLIFARSAALSPEKTHVLATVLMWFSMFVLVAGTLLIGSCIFFRKPLDLSCWLDPHQSCSSHPPIVEPRTEPKPKTPTKEPANEGDKEADTEPAEEPAKVPAKPVPDYCANWAEANTTAESLKARILGDRATLDAVFVSGQDRFAVLSLAPDKETFTTKIDQKNGGVQESIMHYLVPIVVKIGNGRLSGCRQLPRQLMIVEHAAIVAVSDGVEAFILSKRDNDPFQTKFPNVTGTFYGFRYEDLEEKGTRVLFGGDPNNERNWGWYPYYDNKGQLHFISYGGERPACGYDDRAEGISWMDETEAQGKAEHVKRVAAQSGGILDGSGPAKNTAKALTKLLGK